MVSVFNPHTRNKNRSLKIQLTKDDEKWLPRVAAIKIRSLHTQKRGEHSSHIRDWMMRFMINLKFGIRRRRMKKYFVRNSGANKLVQKMR